MFDFLFISFPLMAIAFSNGGVVESPVVGILLLAVLTCLLQVGSFSIACSAHCFARRTKYFTASYLGFLLLCYMIPGMFRPHCVRMG